MFTHLTPAQSADSAAIQQSLLDQRTLLCRLRSEYIERYRPHIYEGPGPIRVMARIVDELTQECRRLHISEEIIQTEIINRTIGDIDLRCVNEYEGDPGGDRDYRMLADELGVALPGEPLPGYIATGKAYCWLREQMMECERLLLSHGYDPRIYDIYGVGNPLLREWLAQEMQLWGLPAVYQQLYLSLGAMDGIDKSLRGLAHMLHTIEQKTGILFPEPGFHVPEWQARSCGYQLYHYTTRPENHFKLTADELSLLLAAHPDLHVIYLTVTNNPTAFAYSPEELHALFAVIEDFRQQQHPIYIIADLAYIGTGKPEDDLARMRAFADSELLEQCIFVSSFSKTYTLTGERFGWVTCGSQQIANAISASWTNSMASLPGEWQLRYMACYRLLQTRPHLAEKLRALYRLRRQRLRSQLQALDEQHHLFADIYTDDDATVYVWCRLQPGEDAFSLFEKTGIAGVPGSGFGYSDEYIRFSIGVLPVTVSAVEVPPLDVLPAD